MAWAKLKKIEGLHSDKIEKRLRDLFHGYLNFVRKCFVQRSIDLRLLCGRDFAKHTVLSSE